jgi:hypothetical protein
MSEAIAEVQFNWQTCIHSGYNLTILSPTLVVERLEKSIEKNGILIVFIEENVKSKDLILEFFDKNDTLYYVNAEKDGMKGTFFVDANDLTAKIRSDHSRITKHLARHGLNFNGKFEDEIPAFFKDEFSDVNSSLCIPNFLMLNQYIGHLWYDSKIQQRLANVDKLPDQSELASGISKDKIDLLIKQLLQFDKFRGAMMTSLPFIEKYLDRQPQYPPIILIMPFFYDYFSKKKGGENIQLFEALSKIEQDESYKLIIPNKGYPKNRTLQGDLEEIVANRLRYLDVMASLHASFTFSPVVRLPIQGRGINRFLSFFNPDGKNPSREKLYSTAAELGMYLSSTIISKLSAEIFKRNRQLVVISNLPFEWMIHDNVCLNFTHDITRIPEMPYHGIRSHYNSNQKFAYSVPKDIMTKTLVIFGSKKDPNFKVTYDFMEEKGKALGFHTAYCNSIQELKDFVHHIKPHLLIFDTHGDTNPDRGTTELQIGDEILTGEDIIEHEIVAPLVILSACNTAPNWGYFNHITNAFFQAGAKSVTGTYLPIGIASGTALYNRILTNLAQCGEKAIHNNWLDFLSHNIRSYYITENMLFYFKKAEELKLSAEEEKALLEKIRVLSSQLMSESMFFHKRKNVFQKLRSEFSSIHGAFEKSKPSITHEQLLYTNLGRGDLIYFDCWLEENAMRPV